jgi:hypothetical protein
MSNGSLKGFKGDQKTRERRTRVMDRLESQLKSGVKTVKGGGTAELVDGDVKRINKELSILKERI